MGTLGDGTGSAYPGALDIAGLEVDSPNAGKTKARADVPNDIYAAVVKIQTALGTDPAGSLTDVKTFLQTEHGADGTHTTDVISEKTATTGVTVDGCLIKDGGAAAVSDGTNIIHTKIINIGDWDMDTYHFVQVAHGVTQTKIRGITAIIRNDAGTSHIPLGYATNISGAPQLWLMGTTSTIIELQRAAGGTFDHTDYHTTSYNRGWISITYID